MLRYHCKVCAIQLGKKGLLCRLLLLVPWVGPSIIVYPGCQRLFTGNVVSDFCPMGLHFGPIVSSEGGRVAEKKTEVLITNCHECFMTRIVLPVAKTGPQYLPSHGFWKKRSTSYCITAPFNNMRTLTFKAQPTNAFFTTVNQMFGGSSQLPTTVWAVLYDLITTRSAVVESWGGCQTFDWR